MKNYETKTDLFIVRSLTMMNTLVRKGFDVVKAEDSEDNPKYKVFLFKNTPSFQRAASDYLSQRRGY